MASPKFDEKHIFSEFEDPVRQQLIAQLSQKKGIAQVRRAAFFNLWFSDISRLEEMVNMPTHWTLAVLANKNFSDCAEVCK